MGITVAVTRAACNTGTGTQDFTTTDLGGLTPKAALFIGTCCATDATPADHAVWSFGAADDVREWVNAATDEHNVADTDTDSGQNLSNCVWFRNPGEQTTDGIAAFDSFITNGVRINWTDAPAAAYLLTVILFAGTDLSVHANWKDMGSTMDVSIDITDPGFTPDLVICAIVQSSDIVGAEASLGVVEWDGAAVTQRCVEFWSCDAKASGRVQAYCRSDAGILRAGLGGSTIRWWGEFSDFDANGFTVTPRNQAPLNPDLCYLALNFNSAVDHGVLTHSTPTSIGNDEETGVGFKPQFVLLLASFCEAVNTVYADNRGGTIGVAAVTSGVQYANSVQSEDAEATTDTQSLSDNVAVELPDHDGSAGVTASFVSFDANGWTLNYTAVEAAAKLFFALAIEEEVAVGGNPWYAYAQQ